MAYGRGIAAVLVLAVAALAQAQTLYRWVDKQGGVHYSDTPPPAAEAREMQEKRAVGTGYVEAGPSYAMRRAQQDFPVTLYTDTRCAAACDDARKLLQARGIAFKESVMKSDEDLAAFRQRFDGEAPSVPSLIVGLQKRVGFEDGIWQKLLDDAGYPRASAPAPSAARAKAQ